jgi:hypothetical protein
VGRIESETINASLTNWHWMEVTGFFYFYVSCAQPDCGQLSGAGSTTANSGTSERDSDITGR